MKKIHLTRFAAMATVALMGSTAAWAQAEWGEGEGYEWNEDTGILRLFSTDNDAIKITESDADSLNKTNSGNGINAIQIMRGAAFASFVTLMLPATVNVEGGAYPAVAAYIPTDYNKGEKTLDFTATTVIEANKPYLVEVSKSSDFLEFYTNWDKPFKILPTGDNEHSTPLENSCWTFTGSYAKKTWETAPSNVYGYAASSEEGDYAGKFVKVGYDVTLPPLRAYLTCTSKGLGKSSTDDVSNLPDVINVRLFGKGGETLAIGTMNTRTGEIQMQDRYYDLKGRKLNSKPQNKIMYVNKKVIKH